MPNWCMNNLTISHADKAMVQKFADAYNSGNTCNSFIPRPSNINNSDCFAEDGWYKWNCNNWGTKWDFGKDEYGDPAEVKEIENQSGKFYEVSISFNTAWSPPIPFYDFLMDLGYDVHASYFEPGCAFCGIYHNGYDNYIDYGGEGMSYKDLIPASIWEEYALDDFFSDKMVGE